MELPKSTELSHDMDHVEKRILRFPRAVTSLFLLTFCLVASAADEPSDSDSGSEPSDSGSESSDDGLLTRTIEDLDLDRAWRWLEEQRDDLSRGVSVVGRNLDGWLAGEGIGERANESYLRVRLNQRVGRFDTYHSNARISGRIDLPRTQERWKLVFDSENTDRESLSNQRLNNMRPSSFTGSFRYESPERNGWRLDQDVGLRGRIPLDPFYRFRVRYDTNLTEDWYLGLSNRISYYHRQSWIQDSRIFFSREVTSQLNFRVETEARYRHEERLTEFGQSVALHQSLGQFETITYQAGVIGRNRPVDREDPVRYIDHYYTQMVYRRAIYEDWLVLELVPQLIFAKEYDWDPDPRIQFNLEIYFFDF